MRVGSGAEASGSRVRAGGAGRATRPCDAGVGKEGGAEN
jgi:hypothetical protein